MKRGDTIKLTTDKAYESKGTKECIYIDYENIQKVVKPGNRIYVDDGLISLIVENIQGSFLTCTIENGGMLGSRKGKYPYVYKYLSDLRETLESCGVLSREDL